MVLLEKHNFNLRIKILIYKFAAILQLQHKLPRVAISVTNQPEPREKKFHCKIVSCRGENFIILRKNDTQTHRIFL